MKINDPSRLVIRSDNGPQMTSNQFRDYIDKVCHHEFIPAGCPNKNAYIESFFSIVEAEFLQVQYFKNYAKAMKKQFYLLSITTLKDFMDQY